MENEPLAAIFLTSKLPDLFSQSVNAGRRVGMLFAALLLS